MLSIITAIDQNNTIGQNGTIPWHIPEEQKLFKKLTIGHPVIMGRKTYETSVKRPLPGRLNIVVSKTKTFPGTTPARSLEEAIKIAKQHNENIFVIGGENIYEQALPLANTLHISHIKRKYKGDAHFLAFRASSTKDRPAEAPPGVEWGRHCDWKATEQTEYADFTYTKYQRT